MRDAGAPRIISTTIAGVTPRAGQYVLTIGKRYEVVVRVAPGNYHYLAGVERRDGVAIPESANLHNHASHLEWINATKEFRFALTPTDVGTYPIAFQMRDAPAGDLGGTGNAFNPDPGITIVAAATDAPVLGALYGRVTPVGGGTLAGGAITVRLDTGAWTQTNPDGSYYFASVPPGPHRVTYEPNVTVYSPAKVVNLRVPVAGIRVDVELEEPFTGLRAAGMPYQRIYDYSRGRTVFHVVRVSASQDRVEILPSISGEQYEHATEIAQRIAGYPGTDPGVVINGGYFDYVFEDEPRCGAYGDYLALGYAYYGLHTSICEMFMDTGKVGPTLGVTNTGGGQWNRIVDKSYRWDTSDWNISGTSVLWDDNRGRPDRRRLRAADGELAGEAARPDRLLGRHGARRSDLREQEAAPRVAAGREHALGAHRGRCRRQRRPRAGGRRR